MVKTQLNPIWIEKAKRWQLNVQKDGQRKTFFNPNPSRAGAADCKRQAREWLEGYESKANMRFNKAWEMYLEDTEPLVDVATFRQHKDYGRIYIKPYIQNKTMGEITEQDWQNVIGKISSIVSKRTGRKLSKKTLMNVRGTIANFCRYAKRSRMITELPDIRIPKQAKKLEKNVLQRKDVKVLFAAKEEWWLYVWQLQVALGLRPSEALGLKWSDIKSKHLTINRAVTDANPESSGKTINARRTIILNQGTEAILASQKIMLKAHHLKVDNWVFPTKDGDRPVPSGVRSAWDRFREKNGINCTMYELRHSFVSIMKTHLSISELKDTLGHSPEMDTLGTYGHEMDGEKEKAAEKIGTVLDSILEPSAASNQSHDRDSVVNGTN